jgi:hypothetical protein
MPSKTRYYNSKWLKTGGFKRNEIKTKNKPKNKINSLEIP